ncbi:MAG: 5-dehydro-2-deoxygluconokinase [Fusobacterium sp. JB019]|nr:5-dehydro-2-deoxygluconokinase [Fusobacterium sp. JB019]
MQILADKKLDVICLGRAGVDLNPIEFNKPIEEVSGFMKSVGGSPANIAVGLSKQNMKVGFIGRVSDDAFGRYITKSLEKLNIDTKGIIKDSEYTNGLALTEVKSPNECGVIFYRENVADLHLCCEDIDEDYIKNSKILVISGTAFASSPSREAAFLAMEYARRNGVIVIMDIDYRAYSWKTPSETSICYTMACEKCDVIIGTREEFDAVEYLWDRENQDDDVTAKRFLKGNTQLVVIKRGADGSTAFKNNGEKIAVGVVPTKIRKTFGAGDAFASGFITSLVNGNDIKTSLIKGSGTASIVISKTDCTDSMPSKEELEEYLKNNSVEEKE